MKGAKLFATAFCAAVIACQAYAIFSRLGYNNWYWPFVNYPMYSDSHRRGESFSSLDLRVLPCSSEAKPLSVSSGELHVKWATFDRLLYEAAGLRDTTSPATAERASIRLHRLATTQLSMPVCAVELWRRTYTIGPQGLELSADSGHLAAEWGLNQAASVSTDSFPIQQHP